jgi:hypothetical protein
MEAFNSFNQGNTHSEANLEKREVLGENTGIVNWGGVNCSWKQEGKQDVKLSEKKSSGWGGPITSTHMFMMENKENNLNTGSDEVMEMNMQVEPMGEDDECGENNKFHYEEEEKEEESEGDYTNEASSSLDYDHDYEIKLEEKGIIKINPTFYTSQI